MTRVLYIGNKNVCASSMRAWLALREKGVTFDERSVDLHASDRAATLASLAPNSEVPVLHDGDLMVFDWLAVMEHANDGYPGPSLTPKDPGDRARGRALVAWLHSGFHELRSGMPFEGAFQKAPVAPPDSALREAARAAEAWERALERSDGPYLFGELSLADLAFAPDVRRLKGYGFPLPRYPRAAVWATELLARPSVREWIAAAESEAARRRSLPP